MKDLDQSDVEADAARMEAELAENKTAACFYRKRGPVIDIIVADESWGEWWPLVKDLDYVQVESAANIVECAENLEEVGSDNRKQELLEAIAVYQGNMTRVYNLLEQAEKAADNGDSLGDHPELVEALKEEGV